MWVKYAYYFDIPQFKISSAARRARPCFDIRNSLFGVLRFSFYSMISVFGPLTPIARPAQNTAAAHRRAGRQLLSPLRREKLRSLPFEVPGQLPASMRSARHDRPPCAQVNVNPTTNTARAGAIKPAGHMGVLSLRWRLMPKFASRSCRF